MINKGKISVFFKEIKRFKLIAAILVCIIIVESVINAVMPHLESNGVIGEKFANIEELEGTYNRLVLGDSRSHQGINPKVLDENSDYKTFNMAAPGMQTPFFYYILSRWIKAKGVPKQVIVNISFYLLGGKQWMDDIYFAYYTPTIEETWDSYANMLNYYPQDAFSWYFRTRIPSIRYNKRIRGLLNQYSSASDHGNFRTELAKLRDMRTRELDEGYQGYLSRGTDRIDDEIDLSTYVTTIHNGYSVYQNYLKRFFELTNEYDFDIYVYDFPWPQQYETSENFIEVHDYYTEMIANVAEMYPRVHMISNEFFYAHEYFVDSLHLNDYGATKLSNEIGTMLNEW